jgi:hypothetical protein
MQTIKSCLMELEDRARPQLERSITVFDKSAYQIEGEIELAYTILGLASGYLIGIAEKRGRLGNTVPVLGQAQ